MGNILGRFLLPHPPAAVPEIGGEQRKAMAQTIESFHLIAQHIAELRPQTIVLITPHGPCFNDHFYMPYTKRISGDFSTFGVKKMILGFDNDIALAQSIQEKAAEKGLSAGFVDDRTMKQNGISYDLDHGTLVPLYFVLSAYVQFKLLPISLSALNGKDHYRFGMVLRDAIHDGDTDVVVIASGDLSHKISAQSPYGMEEAGAIFDQTIRKLLLHEDIQGFLTFDPKLKEKAAQCGLNSYRTLLGTLDGFDFLTRIHSYEAPFGIGYLVAELTQGKAKESEFYRYLAEEKVLFNQRKAAESEPAALARASAETYLQNRKEMDVPKETSPALTTAAGGVFVSFHNDGCLRGCIGTTAPTQPNLAREIIVNAIAAATKDPRFAPLHLEELDELTITVDVLNKPEEIQDQSLLDPERYGIIVENRGRIGVLLPNIEGIHSAEEQIRAAREKAGIHPWRRLKIQRFTVTRYE